MQNTFTGKFWMIIRTAKNHFNKLSLNTEYLRVNNGHKIL